MTADPDLEAPSVEEPVEPAPDAVDPRTRRRTLTAIACVLGFCGLFQAVGSQDSGMLGLAPGPAPLVTVTPHTPEPGAGSFHFTTVKVEHIDLKTYAWARLTDRSLAPDSSDNEDAEAVRAAAQMEESKSLASSLAHSYLDPDAEVVGLGASVLGVDPRLPASDAGVQVGDLITAVEGETVRTENELVEALLGAPSDFTLSLTRGGEPLDLRVNSGTSHVIGVEVTTRTEDSPLSIDTGSVGGPSAGLVFTLADIDALSDGDFTGGRVVAGTGTVDSEGRVGPVGGTEHKVLGAASVGASIFFVPEVDAPAATASAPASVTVVPVATVSDAISYLCAHGGVSRVCRG